MAVCVLCVFFTGLVAGPFDWTGNPAAADFAGEAPGDEGSRGAGGPTVFAQARTAAQGGLRGHHISQPGQVLMGSNFFLVDFFCCDNFW